MAKKDPNRTWYQQKDFKQLQKKWYAKLKKEGFEDIEFIGRNGDSDERFNAGSRADLRKAWSPDKERYFQLAGQWYWLIQEREEYDNKQELIEVWWLHSKGLSYPSIAKQMEIPYSRVRAYVANERDLMLSELVWGK